MLDLQELKTKYPLAFDTIKLPVRYDIRNQQIIDSNEDAVADLGYIIYPDHPSQETELQIGELIAHLLNQLK